MKIKKYGVKVMSSVIHRNYDMKIAGILAER